MPEKYYYLGFSLFPGIGSVLFQKLLQSFGSAKAAWESSEKDFQQTVGEKLAERFFTFKKTIDLEKAYEKCVQKDIQLVILEEKVYPPLLHAIVHPPFLLYVKGNLEILSSPKIISVVGTRKITPYGKQVTELLTTELVEQGFVVVSGLAFGVDATAHMTTVRSSGKTIAVLGCGVDCCSPRENQYIYDQILAHNGTIISNFPPGMQATKGSFPARNALVAGLSQAVVVTEGAAGSGSLITAAYAKKFGRPVFTVPGPITSSLSKGVNGLLKDGAIPVTDVTDILDSLGIMGSLKVKNRSLRMDKKSQSSTVYSQLSQEEQEILELIENGPLHFDEIVRTIGKDSKTVGSLLSLLELKEIIKILSDGSYSL